MDEPAIAYLTLWSDAPLLSALIWLLIAVSVLYLARRPVHELVEQTARSVHRLLRLGARALAITEQRLTRRNREVLLALAEADQARSIEREFRRVQAVIDRDLAGYPALHRELSEQIARIDEDYRLSADVPPAPPAWLEAVQAVARIEANGDPAVAKVLEDIHQTLQAACHSALLEYRASSRRRHLGLKRLSPYWRRLTGAMGNVQRTVEGLSQRSQAIDAQMERYQEIRVRDDATAQRLAASAWGRLFSAGAVLLLAIAGAAVNYELLVGPLDLILGAGSAGSAGEPGPIARAAAVTVVLLAVAAGFFIIELLGVTRLFALAQHLEDGLRRRLLWSMAAVLTALALLEVVLAFGMREPAALAALLGGEAIDPLQQWLGRVGHGLTALVLTAVLALIAVPLEAFLHSFRTVAGSLGVTLLRLTQMLLRLLGALTRALAVLLLRCYDVLIFAPLWLEHAWLHRGGRGTAAAAEPRPAPAPTQAPVETAEAEPRS